MQTVVIDAHGHMLGRLASIAAKQLLTGQQLVSTSDSKEASGFREKEASGVRQIGVMK